MTELIWALAPSRLTGVYSVDEQVDDRVRFGVEVVLAPAQHPVGGHLVEGAKEDLRGGGGADVLAEGAALLAVGDRLPDQLEVVLEERLGEALHELHRLPQFNLEHHGEVLVAAEAPEMQVRELAEPLRRIGDAGNRLAAFGEHLVHRSLEDRDEQVVLALEVEVDGAGRDAGDARDVGDLRLEIAVLGEDLRGCAQDRIPLLAGRRPAAGRRSDAGLRGSRIATE